MVPTPIWLTLPLLQAEKQIGNDPSLPGLTAAQQDHLMHLFGNTGPQPGSAVCTQGGLPAAPGGPARAGLVFRPRRFPWVLFMCC